MARVFNIRDYESSAPSSVKPKTIQNLLGLGYNICLTESKTYDLEQVCQSLLSTTPAIPRTFQAPLLVVAPAMGCIDFSSGGIVDFSDASLEDELDRSSLLHSAFSQLIDDSWVEERFLWEIAIHDFISVLDKNNPTVDVDSERLGAFWANGKADFKKRLNTGKLASDVDFTWGGEGIAFRRFKRESTVKKSRDHIFGRLRNRVLAYHKVLPTPLRDLTRAEVAELLQRNEHVDTSKRATRDSLIASRVGNLKPGFFRRKSQELATLLEERNYPENLSVRSHQNPDGSYQLF